MVNDSIKGDFRANNPADSVVPTQAGSKVGSTLPCPLSGILP
jgi:hypothetical protein